MTPDMATSIATQRAAQLQAEAADARLAPRRRHGSRSRHGLAEVLRKAADRLDSDALAQDC